MGYIITGFALLLIAALLGLIALLLYRTDQRYQAYSAWQKRAFSMRYSFSEDARMRIIRSRLARKVDLFGRTPGTLGLDEIQRMERDDPRFRGDLQYVMGRLASMCTALIHNVADEAVCRDLQAGSVIRYFHFFEKYIHDLRRLSNNPKIYSCLEQYAVKWEKQRTQEPSGEIQRR